MAIKTADLEFESTPIKTSDLEFDDTPKKTSDLEFEGQSSVLSQVKDTLSKMWNTKFTSGDTLTESRSALPVSSNQPKTNVFPIFGDKYKKQQEQSIEHANQVAQGKVPDDIQSDPINRYPDKAVDIGLEAVQKGIGDITQPWIDQYNKSENLVDKGILSPIASIAKILQTGGKLLPQNIDDVRQWIQAGNLEGNKPAEETLKYLVKRGINTGKVAGNAGIDLLKEIKANKVSMSIPENIERDITAVIKPEGFKSTRNFIKTTPEKYAESQAFIKNLENNARKTLGIKEPNIEAEKLWLKQHSLNKNLKQVSPEDSFDSLVTNNYEGLPNLQNARKATKRSEVFNDPIDIMERHVLNEIDKGSYTLDEYLADPKAYKADALWQQMMNESGNVNIESAANKIKNSTLGKATQEIRQGISPTSVPGAENSSDIIRNGKAAIANDQAIQQYKYKKVSKLFDKQPGAEQIANISNYEKTGQIPNSPEGYSEFYRKSTDNSNAILNEVYGQDRVGYVDNYVKRKFIFASEGDEINGVNFLKNKSLSADKSPLKGRPLEMPLDEALNEMHSQGINVRPATTNMETLRQWTAANAKQALEYKNIWERAKEEGAIHFIKLGDNIPKYVVELDDRVAKVFFPSDQDMVMTGKYYASPQSARIFNNAIAKGLGGSPTYRGIRQITNAINQVQLGFTLYHGMTTALNSGIQETMLTAKNVASGNFKEAGKSALGSIPGVGATKYYLNFTKFIKGLVNDDPAAIKYLNEKFNPAGGRLNIQSTYLNNSYAKFKDALKNQQLNNSYAKFKDALKNQQYVKAFANGALAIPETVAKPLMQYGVPRVKGGALMARIAEIDRRFPNLTSLEKAHLYGKAWDSVDNIFGQMTYDNKFWNKTAQDLAMITTRSVGWNAGTISEIGGGILDVRKLLKGEITDKLLYTITLPIYVGALGAIYQKVRTGEGPSELKDYFYPKNGDIDENGEPARDSFASYMKDVYSYGTHPLTTLSNKAASELSMIIEMIENKDYYGNKIFEDEGSKLLQGLEFAGKAAIPFGIRNADRQDNKKISTKVLPFVGITPAPYSINMTPFEEKMHDYNMKKQQVGGRTQAQAERSKTAREVTKDLKSGNFTDESGQKLSTLPLKQIAKITGSLSKEKLQKNFERLTLNEAFKSLEKATPKEMEDIMPALANKLMRADPQDLLKYQDKIDKLFNKDKTKKKKFSILKDNDES